MGSSARSNPPAKAAAAAAEAIAKRIFSGALAPGQRLPESEWMSELSVGRSTIREAFLRLEADGLVELHHQRGAAVLKLSRAGMAELFEIRESLEGTAAALAADRARTKGDRAWLAEQRRIWSGAAVMTNELVHMDRNLPFHEGIIEMSRNRRLARMLRPLQVPGYRTRFLPLMGPRERRQSAADHLEILSAIAAGRGDLAERRMRRHVRRAARMAQQIPDLG